MAAQIMDSDFLPKDLFMAEKPQLQDPNPSSAKDFFCFPDEFPYDYDSSGLGSPVESMTETEDSDEEDPSSYNMLAALTKKMAHSFIINQDDVTQKSTTNVAKDCPQDLLFPQHGMTEKTRRKVVAAATPTHHREINSPVNTGVYYPNTALTHRQMQVNQFHELKQQQMLRLQQQCSAAWGRHNRPRRGFGFVNNQNHNLVTNARPNGISPSVWPPLQPHRHTPQQGSGMRAVFLGEPNAGKQTCGGTGVFLPRGAGANNDVPKKPSCSTVLLPARVVQALNLNLEDLGPPGRFPVTLVLNHDKVMVRNSSNPTTVMSQKKSFRHQGLPAGLNNTHYELRLPQEWSY